MSQSPYLLDLAPAEFFFLPKLKTPMREKRFAKIGEVKIRSDVFRGLKKRWHKFIISEGGYFVGEKIVIDK